MLILKDAGGNVIRPANTEYKMIVIDKDLGVVLGINVCNGDTIWRFYKGGNHYMAQLKN